MSLRTEFLDELNTLAKSKDVPALIAKMREVMVDRHPATFSSEERDPVETVALAWQEVAARGRPSFEAAIFSVLSSMESARLSGNTDESDWPLIHAILKLLRMLPYNPADQEKRNRMVRLLSGSVAERQDLLILLTGVYQDATALWTDAFRLYLVWHERQPGWLDVLWSRALSDEHWPVNDGAAAFMEDAARRHPDFITMDRLVRFWQSALRRKESTEDLKRWFYIIGASLEESPAGRAALIGLYEAFGGHLQDYRHESPNLAWDHFVEVVSAMFRNPTRQSQIRAFKSAAKSTASVRDHHEAIPHGFKAPPESVSPALIQSLLFSREAA